MKLNVVVGKPLVESWQLIAFDKADWEANEKEMTLFTETRSLPHILVEAGIVKSVSEVRRNRPELVKELITPDCLWIKWGKKRVFIVVGKMK